MNLKFIINSLFMAIALLVSAGCTTENGDGNESSHVANQQVSLSFYNPQNEMLAFCKTKCSIRKTKRILLRIPS